MAKPQHHAAKLKQTLGNAIKQYPSLIAVGTFKPASSEPQMGLFASDNYWNTDWDQYLHSETFLEDVPPLVVPAVGSKHVLWNSMDPWKTERQSQRQTTLELLRRMLFSRLILKSLNERTKSALIPISKETVGDLKSPERACDDSDLVRSTKGTENDGLDDIETFPIRWEPEIPQLPDCIVPMDVPDKSAEADTDAPDPLFFDFGNSITPIFDEIEAIKSGGTSQVLRARIHPSYIPDHDGEGKGDIVFAVKKIYSQSSQDFARERDAYRRMNLAQNPHPHIVPLLASYRMEGKYHFVFPLAICDLATYWRTQSRPRNDRRGLEWFGGQMRGLADAVSTIHGQKDQVRDLHGRHGDIKPENILYFDCGDSNSRAGFALTDFGSSYFCIPEERDIPKGLKHTPAYRAPEIDTTTLGITQAYDIWSLGCIFAEAIAWYYNGKAGIAKLIDARLDEKDNSPNRDAFFRLQYDKQGGLTAKLKPQVHRVLISLREKSQSSLFIDDMLYLVLEGMLKVSISERMSAREILDALTQMCKKLEDDPTYSVLYNTKPTLEHVIGDPMEMVHTQNARQRLDRTVDATYYTNTTTQSLSDAAAHIGLKLRFACPYHKADELLLDHQHQETPCPKRKPEAVYGMMSREQAARLRSLKRKSSKESEEDRWFDIYRIIFPNFNRMVDSISPYHESNTTSLSTINSTSLNGISQYKDYLLNRDAEEYAAKLAKMDIHITLEAAAKLLKLQVKDLERFDETMREPVQAYRFETDGSREKTGVEGGAPTETVGSSDFFGSMQLVARYTDDKTH
ncbi:serine threonine kinase [Fusarium circinatum]|uniref:Serine threonine kinase n=1 Tax=Fusarium circinatum TaxID=48490 RepID=A0A8H5TMC5_FUSCI|nr:serine threonine kinase [Fusarium circinatum]